MSAQKHPPVSHVIFLDGDCVFCQNSATLLHRLDHRKQLYFAPLQGETANILPASWRDLKDEKGRASGALVLIENWKHDHPIHWQGFDAVLRSLYLARGIFVIFWPLHWLPEWLKSQTYQFVARQRHRLTFGKKNCPLPDEHFRKHLLP